jgi:hypothetical protein
VNKQLTHCVAAVLLGLGLAGLLLWLGAVAPVRADAHIHCVNLNGTGCDAVCGGGCYASVQAAVDSASPGSEIRIAAGTYTDPAGTVAVITKELAMRGGYGQSCNDVDFDPDLYQTVLDAQWGGSVISITNVSHVQLFHLALTNGDGTGNLSGMGAGGGIFNCNTNLLVAHSIITDNLGSHSGRGWGGGIYSYSQDGSHLTTLVQNRIVSNTAGTDPASNGDGGGVYVLGGEASLVENQIVDNLGHGANQSQGGGVFLESLMWGEVLTNVIQGNVGSRTTNGYGSGLYISGGRVRVASNRIEDNWSSSGNGGGLESAWSDIEITGNRIISNTSGAGGGVFIRSLTPVTMANNLIVRNDGGFRGGGVYLVSNLSEPTPAILVNNTVADNGPDGIATWGYVTLTMTNNLLAGNPVGILASHPASLTLAADTNLFWNTSDPITGSNAIQQDPLLTSDYHLGAGSPAVDAGLTIPWLAVDLDGCPRPQDSGYDIGAFEGGRREVFLPLVLRGG